jgi:hypothetical protein
MVDTRDTKTHLAMALDRRPFKVLWQEFSIHDSSSARTSLLKVDFRKVGQEKHLISDETVSFVEPVPLECMNVHKGTETVNVTDLSRSSLRLADSRMDGILGY